MNHAYTQHSSHRDYQGFMGKIVGFMSCGIDTFLRVTEAGSSMVGIFFVTKFNFDNVLPDVKVLLTRFRYFVDGNAYISPVLDWAKKRLNVDFEIAYGCIGMRYTFEFPEYMFQRDPDAYPEDEEGPRHYAKYVGACSKISEYASISMYGDHDIFQLMFDRMKERYGDMESVASVNHPLFVVGQEDGFATIEYANKSQFAYPHFSAFVTGYMVSLFFC